MAAHSVFSRLRPGHVVLAIATLFVCWYPYPGRMNNDTLYQIAQVRTGHIEDLHAWPLQVLWHPLYSLGLHPGPAYVCSIVLFAGSAYVILRWTLSRNAASIFLTVAMLSPPLLAQLQSFSKDSWLLIFVLAATACIGQAFRGGLGSRSEIALMILGVAFIWLAAGARSNGLVLALPLSVPIGLWIVGRRTQGPERPPSAWWRALVVGATGVLLVVVVVGSQQVLHRIANVYPSHSDDGLYIYDLANLSVLEHRVLLPPFLYPSQDLGLLESRTIVGNVDPLMQGYPPLFGEAPLATLLTLDDAQREELRHDWLDAVRKYPTTYVRSRLTMLTKLLGFRGTPADVVGDHAVGNAQSIEPVFPWAVDAVDNYTHWGTYDTYGFLEEGPAYFKPWLYLVLLTMTAALAWLGRLARHIRIMTASLWAGALLYTATFAVLSPAAVYRYLFPCVAIAVLFAPVALRGAMSRWNDRTRGRTGPSGELGWQS